MAVSKNIFPKLYRRYKYLRRDIGSVLGMDSSFYKSARGSKIIIYHGICKHDPTRFSPIFLKLKTFEWHLRFYKKYFNVISLDDYYEQRFSKDKFNVCLSFDDGYANNHKYVLPLLKEYQVPAAFFITAIRDAGYDILWNDFLRMASKYGPGTLIYQNESFLKNQVKKYISTETGNSLVEILRSASFKEKAEMMRLLSPLVPFKKNKSEEDYWLQMTKEQIRELSASSLVTIGSHGHYHNDLTRISTKDASEEMTHSKQYLENIIEKPIIAFAFPYGTYTPAVIEKAKETGYSQLLAMDFHLNENNSDSMMRERFTVNPYLSVYNQMYATITGKYE